MEGEMKEWGKGRRNEWMDDSINKRMYEWRGK